MSASSFRAAAAVAVRRNLSRGIPYGPITNLRSVMPFFLVERAITTEALPSVFSTREDPGEDDLKARIFRLRFPKRSATAAVEKWVGEGKKVMAAELRRIAGDLRRAQRFKHALEISEWMLTHQAHELSDSDYAVRIDLINKVFGTAAAEEFFEGLPSTAKNCETYTALLHAYAGAKLVEKAESLFERIKESSVPLSTLAYNEIMTLYVSIGQADKVILVAEELRNSSVSSDLFTYNLWISACAYKMDIDGIRKILDEMCCDPNCNSDWKTYVQLTDIYISTCHLKNTMNSLVEADDTKPKWITYDFLVILYTALGNKERVDEIWKSLQLTSQNMSTRSYVCIISSYLTLGHLKEVAEILDEWKQVKGLEFDLSVCNRLYDAFLKADLVPIAENLRQLMLERDHELVNIFGKQRRVEDPREHQT
ncbi:hypothetical protein Taro_034763 [Colocasia esculenta]|uniref:Pentatricopeptide repeat-containing protein n=1 Tax=Colocasia esculenta TaxID=4460 RepID=A0A843VYL2_COLES|nr:hypothetical protein [Colocasia esculenta]